MSNRFEAMTDGDFDHAIGMYQAALGRRDTETQAWRRLVFDLVRAAGGTIRIGMNIMLVDSNHVLLVHRDPDSGDMIYRVKHERSA